MFRTILAVALVSASSANAGCVGAVVMGNCAGTYIDVPSVGTPASRGSQGGYRGSSGTRYQYDLANPSESLSYSIDLGAQMRDQMSLDPGRNLDRGLGQYGGGIYGN